MRKNKTDRFLKGIALLAMGYWIILVNGTVVHSLDLPALIDSSDLIVTGRVTYVSEEGSASVNISGASIPGRRVQAILAADEVLKGTIATQNLPLEFVVPAARSGVQAIPRGQYGIFFLLRGAPGSAYTVADPVYPFLPAVSGGRITTGPFIDRVTAKLGEVLGDQRSTEGDISTALGTLARIPGKTVNDTLRVALETSTGDSRLLIASKLVVRNDIAGLEVVENALLDPAERSNYLFSTLAASLAGLKDPRSIPALKRLIETNDPRIIKSAAIALRQSGTAAALDPLSALLDNEDEQVKYYAVVGLGEITEQSEHTPAFNEFHEHEAKYLSYWREWAIEHLH
jgi:hypothetical protein